MILRLNYYCSLSTLKHLMSPASSLSDGAYVLHWGKETFFLILVIDNNDDNIFM